MSDGLDVKYVSVEKIWVVLFSGVYIFNVNSVSTNSKHIGVPNVLRNNIH